MSIKPIGWRKPKDAKKIVDPNGWKPKTLVKK